MNNQLITTVPDFVKKKSKNFMSVSGETQNHLETIIGERRTGHWVASKNRLRLQSKIIIVNKHETANVIFAEIISVNELKSLLTFSGLNDELTQALVVAFNNTYLNTKHKNDIQGGFSVNKLTDTFTTAKVVVSSQIAFIMFHVLLKVLLRFGDEYWIDEYKLKKQFDLLAYNTDKISCFTKSYLVDDKGERTGDNVSIPIKSGFTFEDVLKTARFFIPTAPMFYRKDLPKPFPLFFHNTGSGDTALCLTLLQKGNGLCLYEETAIYRHHGERITRTLEHIDHAFVKLFKTYEYLNEYYQYILDHVFRRQLLNMSKTMLRYGSKGKKGIKKLKHAAKSFSIYFKCQPRLDLKEVIYYTNVLFFTSILMFKKNSQLFYNFLK